MKKVLLLMVLFGTVSICSIHAQIAWGARVGLCYSTISGDGEEVGGKPSIEIGPTAYYTINDRFYLNSGLMFSVKNFDYSDGDYSENLRGYYLELPLYAGYAFSSGKTTFYAQAGPYIGFKVAESFDSSYGGISDDLLNSFNAGLGGAIGVNIKKFKIELGYQQGLVNVVDGGDATIGSVFAGISYVF